MKIRLYGVDRGEGSWTRVSRGVKLGLEACGALASFLDVSRVDDPSYDELEEGHDVETGLTIGPPLAASVMLGRGEHVRRLLMIASNSSWLPASLMERSNKIVTGYVGPSDYSVEVISSYVEEHPVYKFLHGVEPGFSPMRGVPKHPNWSVLHLASTHMQRKGTRELLQGWGLALRKKAIPETSVLRMVIDGPKGVYLSEIHRATHGVIEHANTIDILPRLDLPVEDMRYFYSQHHLVAQPSRAEGFGMVPLEARACGVPVLGTSCTGHAEHMNEHHASGALTGVILVPHGEEGPVDDGPGALAPTLSSEDVCEALVAAYSRRDELQTAALDLANSVREAWSWPQVTELFLESLKS